MAYSRVSTFIIGSFLRSFEDRIPQGSWERKIKDLSLWISRKLTRFRQSLFERQKLQKSGLCSYIQGRWYLSPLIIICTDLLYPLTETLAATPAEILASMATLLLIESELNLIVLANPYYFRWVSWIQICHLLKLPQILFLIAYFWETELLKH